MIPRLVAIAALALAPLATALAQSVSYYTVPDGARPHDVAPAPDGTVWYTAQRQGALGRLDPATGEVEQIKLGTDSAPHGVIVGPDGAAWVTDGGLNAIVRVDPATKAVQAWPLPETTGYTNLNTAAFDGDGVLWFTGQNGWYGSLDPSSGAMRTFEDPDGRGPYGIAATPQGEIWFASLAGSHIARIDRATGAKMRVDPPTEDQGARRVWSDGRGRIWVSEWNSGQVSVHDPADGSWRVWKLPGDGPKAYAVYVDERDIVWLSDFGANAMVRFDPATETFQSFPSDRAGANVRQILGRAGEVWGAESGTDRLVVIREGAPG